MSDDNVFNIIRADARIFGGKANGPFKPFSRLEKGVNVYYSHFATLNNPEKSFDGHTYPIQPGFQDALRRATGYGFERLESGLFKVAGEITPAKTLDILCIQIGEQHVASDMLPLYRAIHFIQQFGFLEYCP